METAKPTPMENRVMKRGDKVRLLPYDELLSVFNRRKFFNEDFRQIAASKLANSTGSVHDIEEKYANDYFFFMPDDTRDTWSIPVESVTPPTS